MARARLPARLAHMKPQHPGQGARAPAAVAPPHGDYRVFGLRIRSELALPELPQAPGDGPPDVVVRLGPMAARGADADEVRIDLPGVGVLQVRGGREILVAPAPGAEEAALRVYVLGSALGAICHQRRLSPLHANAIDAGGWAVAFAGESGAGKSTLADYFRRAGHAVLTDDVCVVELEDGREPMAWPGIPRIKLWLDALAATDRDPKGLERVMEKVDKFQVPLAATGSFDALPLRRLYVLRRADGETQAGVVRLTGADAVQAVLSNTYRSGFVSQMKETGGHFTRCVSLARRLEVYAAYRTWGFDVFDAEAARIRSHVLGAADGSGAGPVQR